ncbi:MAG: sulfatase-like hydrolase/transferase [Phycisphaerales bacterium]
MTLRTAAVGLAAASLLATASIDAAPDKHAGDARPNVLVVVLDDLGIDNFGFEPFGWNQSIFTPDMPVLAEIAAQGVSFRNFWAAPECSPFRAAMLTGRYGFRTGVVTALVDPMLPVNQLHPSEITVPKLVREAGYRTGMIGKYHMGGGPENTPAGYTYQAPNTSAGLDYYDGYWSLPPSIDPTVGGQTPEGVSYDCGAPTGFTTTGAACFPNGTCIEGINPFEAMAIGATPLLAADGTLAQSCADGDCAAIDFTLGNAYYAWDRVITLGSSAIQLPDPWREYLTSFISRRGVEWIEQARVDGVPWMAFVTHSASHTPIQTPPPSLTGPAVTDVSCSLTGLSYRQVFKLMNEAVDRSIGEMLVDLDLATVVKGKVVLRDPQETNTVIIVVNDNGSLGSTVLLPFNPLQAKQTVYETGVRSPCIIAGPMVAAPGRAVDATVSNVDLFSLLNDICGIDWQSRIPEDRIVDALPMLPYLVNPEQEEIREYNFAIYEGGTFVPGQVGPCINGGAVIDNLITSPALCADNGGCWAGGAPEAPYPVTNYCDLYTTDPDQAIVECGGTNYCFLPPDMADQCPIGTKAITPPSIAQYGIRRGQWKLVVVQQPECLIPNNCVVEFYLLPEPVAPDEPGIESSFATVSWNPLEEDLPPVAFDAYLDLRDELFSMLASQPPCPADGNLDGVVDSADLAGLLGEWGGMGFWDVNLDGIVDGTDLGLLMGSWGPCVPPADPAQSGIPDCLYEIPAQVVRDYQLASGTYADNAGSGVDAEPLGGTFVPGGYAFADGAGLRIPVDGLDLEDFQIDLWFTPVAQGGVLGKILDFFDRTEDRGFYRDQNGNLFQFLPPFSPTSPGAVTLGVPVQVTLSRNSDTRTLICEIDGVVQWTMEDLLGLAVPPADGFITCFSDDAVTKYLENFAGVVSRIRIASRSAN